MELIDELGALKPMEMIALVKTLEEKWGVSSAVQVAQFNPQVEIEAQGEEKTEFNVELLSFGDAKMAVIKTLRVHVKELGLLDAKKLVESAGEKPALLLEGTSKSNAETLKKELEAVGAKIQIV